MEDSLTRTPMKHCAKFDAANFILGGEIRNRTNTQNYKLVPPEKETDGYPHMPSLRLLAARNSSDIGLLGAKSPRMGDSLLSMPLNHRVQNLTPLTLSSPENSVTVQTNKKQTVNDISTYLDKQNKQIGLRPSSGRPYIHTCRSYVHTPHELNRHAITVRLPTLNFTAVWVCDSSYFGLLREQSFPNKRFLLKTPVKHRAKFDVASFIL